MDAPKPKSQNERPFIPVEPRPPITTSTLTMPPDPKPEVKPSPDVIPPVTTIHNERRDQAAPKEPLSDGHSMEFTTIEFLEDAIDKRRLELLASETRGLEPLFSPTALKGQGKPGRVYRAVFNDPRRVSELKAQGYKITKDEEFMVGERKPSGEFTYKDTVLMDVDAKSYIDRHAGYRSALDAQSQAVRQNAREKLNRILRDDGKQSSHKDHTFDDSIQGSTRNYVSDSEE